MDEFRPHHRPGADRLRIVDKTTRGFFDDGDEDNGETDRPETDRGPLQTLRLGSLAPDIVVWNSQFAALSPQGEG